MKSRASLFIAMVWVLAAPNEALADDIGRYQAVPLPRAENQFGQAILILDTSSGDLWQWWQASPVGDSPGGEGITYIGRMKPGSAPGEVRTIDRFPVQPKKPH